MCICVRIFVYMHLVLIAGFGKRPHIEIQEREVNVITDFGARVTAEVALISKTLYMKRHHLCCKDVYITMCVCVCVCMCLYHALTIYTCKYMCIYMYVCSYVYTCIYRCVGVDHTYIRVYIGV